LEQKQSFSILDLKRAFYKTSKKSILFWFKKVLAGGKENIIKVGEE